MSKIVLDRWGYKTNSHQISEEVGMPWKLPINGPTCDTQVNRRSCFTKSIPISGLSSRRRIGPTKLAITTRTRLGARTGISLELFLRHDLFTFYCCSNELSYSVQAVVTFVFFSTIVTPNAVLLIPWFISMCCLLVSLCTLKDMSYYIKTNEIATIS